MLLAQNSKKINDNSQAWTSINTLATIDKHWALIGDFHIRRNAFMHEPGFYFIRTGAAWYCRKDLFVALGYGHMWLATNIRDHYIYAGENRLYQQLQYHARTGRIGFTQRIRNEQRWQQKIVNGQKTGYERFSDRIRYLFSVSIPIFKDVHWPELVIADEVAVQFGREIIYNRFDQNRFFIGIRQKLSQQLSFDFGYLYQYQQKYTPHEVDENQILRLFFYYQPRLRN